MSAKVSKKNEKPDISEQKSGSFDKNHTISTPKFGTSG